MQHSFKKYEIIVGNEKYYSDLWDKINFDSQDNCDSPHE
jgi:hypothetical protein